MQTFVTGSDKSQKDFYGSQQVRNDVMKSSDSGGAPLTEDEKNKLSAKILKAEMKGDTVRKHYFCHLIEIKLLKT